MSKLLNWFKRGGKKSEKRIQEYKDGKEFYEQQATKAKTEFEKEVRRQKDAETIGDKAGADACAKNAARFDSDYRGFLKKAAQMDEARAQEVSRKMAKEATKKCGALEKSLSRSMESLRTDLDLEDDGGMSIGANAIFGSSRGKMRTRCISMVSLASIQEEDDDFPPSAPENKEALFKN